MSIKYLILALLLHLLPVTTATSDPNNTLLFKRDASSCVAGQYYAYGICQPCPSTYYTSTGGQTSCKMCPGGTYSAIVGATSCTPCPANTFSADGNPSCVPCSQNGPGQYNPPGTGYNCKYCPAGNLVTSQGTCVACPAGYSCSTPGQTVPTMCATGTYSNTGSTTCTTCPAGQVSGPGAFSCAVCPAGSEYKNGACQQCASTYFNPTAGAACRMCPGGTYSSIVGATSCTTCPANTFSVNGNPSCVACSLSGAGYYAPPGQANGCLFCPAGSYITSSGTCVTCPAGSYCPTAGVTSPIPCGGDSRSAAGATSCYACPGGTTLIGGVTGQCQCSPTYYSSTGISSAATPCIHCPGGYVANLDGYGATSCVACVVNTFSQGGWPKCVACPTGFYAPVAQADYCLPCSVGSIITTAGTCTLCPAGRTSNAAQTACVLVPSGIPTRKRAMKCDVGLTACPSPGMAGGYVCKDLQTDIHNCGGCGAIDEGEDCTVFDDRATATCHAGECHYACPKGWDLTPSGCERFNRSLERAGAKTHRSARQKRLFSRKLSL